MIIRVRTKSKLFKFLVPLLHKSWDNWNRFYNEIMRNARIIKESGISDLLRVANGGFAPAPDFFTINTDKEQEY